MSNTLAYVHNLTDLATWTVGGSHAKARFQWVFNDVDGGAQTFWQVRVYADSAGVAGALLFTSGKTAGAATQWLCTTAQVLGTPYWWSIELWDAFGESSGESAKTSYKMRWGQAIYQFNPGAWANQSFASAAVPANTQKALMFRGATGAAGAGAESVWHSNVGEIDTATYGWLNVLVRLATNTAGTQPTLSDMTLTYTGATNAPDHWQNGGQGTFILDSGNYRYGSRSYKVTSTTTGSILMWPYRFAAGDDIPVLENTDYVWSCFVRVAAGDPMTGANQVRLIICDGGTFTQIAAGVFGGPAPPFQSYGDGRTTGNTTAAYPEGWQRLILRFRTGDGQTLVRPCIQFINTAGVAGDIFWVDGAKFESGTVASAWSPGWVGAAVTIDSYGVSIDGSGGATMRLRNVAGTMDVVLDDVVTAAKKIGSVYEEGTFTPTAAYATVGTSTWVHTTRNGWYTKMANLVFFDLLYNGTPTNGTAAGLLLLTAFPFAASSTANHLGMGSCGLQGYTKANFTWVAMRFTANGSTSMDFRASGSGQVTTQLAVGDIPTGGAVIVRASGSYFVD